MNVGLPMGTVKDSATSVVEDVFTEPATEATLDTCLDGWGPDLLGYLLGAGLDGELARWRLRDALSSRQVRIRLRLLHDLLLLFPEPALARAWVRNLNPELGGRSPATVIRRGGSDALPRLLTLAEVHTAKL